ncbi:MAG TPA: protein phosphatase 2C domain-containing protein [Caldisericia bacterium]|nr:protein phosphatase 2C domain-containing protein [Caldisericia bacterium]HQL66694.1 protein phosphatase 2C domain-containing protein [Caldisericia bacterium]HQN49367.1 protein phosphatase 2C domain-containing protein [Caldisericia bacterium]HQO99604.1 protein phosphatase 2C domain-containing protein [Caldisericia bacterium]
MKIFGKVKEFFKRPKISENSDIKANNNIINSKNSFAVETYNENETISYDYDIKRLGGGSKPRSNRGNQDSFFIKKNVVTIADGVGSSVGSEEASKIVTESFTEFCLNEKDVNFETIEEIWKKLGEELKKEYENYKNSNEINFNRVITSCFATTLLSLIETEKYYFVTYLGNGSIWYIRGDFVDFFNNKNNRKWPWCAVDLLIPHTSYNGDEILFGILDQNGLNGSPKIFKIKKDSELGEIFILTTDGVSSNDKVRIIYDENEPSIPKFSEININIYSLLIELKNYIDNYIDNDEDNKTLNDLINNFLNKRKFDDDATIAISISEKAIEYIKNRKQEVKDDIAGY